MNKARILVIDDEQIVCELLEQFLTNIGHEVRYALNGKDALELYKTFAPHLTLLDVIMPKMSGIAVLQRIRDMDKKSKVIMISGMHDLEMAKEAITMGAVDYITKPVDLEFLAKFISQQVKEIFGSDEPD